MHFKQIQFFFFFLQKYACKKKIIDHKVIKLYRFSKVYLNVGENALFWRGHLS